MADIIELMERYNLTLRRLPAEVVSIVRKNGELVREVQQKKSGWIVKICKNHNSIQKWSMKDDFYAETPEEAIQKAIKHIKQL